MVAGAPTSPKQRLDGQRFYGKNPKNDAQAEQRRLSAEDRTETLWMSQDTFRDGMVKGGRMLRPASSQVDGTLSDKFPDNFVGEEDGLVRVLPPEDQLLLLDQASRFHHFRPQTCEKRDLQYADKFQDLCKRKYGSLMLAWRWLLDKEGIGRVPFPIFCESAKSIGFREPRRLWCVLNKRQSSFLTLDEWDPVSFRNMYEFRCVCLTQFGTMETAFLFGMDKTGSRTVTSAELERFCDDFDFSGDVKKLFEALDYHRHGFLTLDECEILAKWEGERFGLRERHFDFQFARLQKRKHKQNVHLAKYGCLPGQLLRSVTQKLPDIDWDPQPSKEEEDDELRDFGMECPAES
jgi:hypothetical protein